ncbi:MAG: glycosyltransferase, partial [Phenylobacterium sp.]|nr:glycosyltransferase [Phenylobacterium sp.]
LQAHRLAYGYGPYWGANALAMEALTDGAVTIRPVVFQRGRVARRPVEASSLWFAPQAEPAGAPLFLVIRTDIEGCPALKACEAAARSQFGAPSERLVEGDAVVLVWRHPLAPLIDP